ncbi:MAG: neutral/alkaline non-lysosomal ceramidase N-terminal domain-containing protein [Acidobacteria bacterium]|nr:neutral/alkaline non-lysosomal ceramidase N-terminal domain-containing protein [Acidobacteriota bacterium]
MKRRRLALISAMGAIFALAVVFCAQEVRVFRAGAARRDITPREPVPMWGYASRHDALSQGTLDPLFADAVVLQAGRDKLALVGLDLGRSPSDQSLERIRKRIGERTGIRHSVIAGSHTHHGPVLELSDEPGKGRGKFDAAIRYCKQLEDAIVEAVAEADRTAQPARVASGTMRLDGWNRNRHSKLESKPTDRDLVVVRLDGRSGKPIATIVNFAAHPTSIPAGMLQFSADYVGAVKDAVRRETGAAALFFNGAHGDQSAERGGRDHRAYGEALGREAVKLSRTLESQDAAGWPLEVREERFWFASRFPHSNPVYRFAFERAFFPELVANYAAQYAQGVEPRLTVATLGGDLALVAVSGEFFSNHANRLKERARVKTLLFAGDANGYHQYFPTIEAVAEGGYGADSAMAPAAIGAGEQMMDLALRRLYEMRGHIK